MSLSRRKMDIEHLLRWAFGYELLKSSVLDGHVPITTSYQQVSMYGQMTPHMISDGVNRMPEELGEAHVDALVIEGAVKSLPDMEAVWSSSRELIIPEFAPLLLADHHRMKNYSVSAEALIMLHAKMATRPMLPIEMPKPERIIGRNGKILVEFKTNTRNHLSARARCPLRYEPDPVSVACERIDYSIWYGSLTSLADSLKERLSEYQPVPPAVAPMPWITGQTPESTVHDDGKRFDPIIDRLPLRRHGHAPLPPIKPKHGPARQVYTQDAGDGD